MKKYIITLIGVCNIYFAISQTNNYINYYLKVHSADYYPNLYKEQKNRFLIADSIYNDAFKMVAFVHPNDYFAAAINACKMDSLEKAKNYLICTIETGFPINEVKNFKGIKPLKKSKYWSEYKKEYKKGRKVYAEKVDKKLRNRINLMYENDQKFRNTNSAKKFKKQLILDSLNLIGIVNLQKEYGKIPGIKELGFEGMMLLYIIFRHVNEIYTINTLGPQIIEQSKNGDFYPRMGPGIIDYKLFTQVKNKGSYMTRQKYGTQIMRTPKTHTSVIIPVYNFEGIDSLRRTVGLGPIIETTSAIYDEDLVKKECGNSFEF